MAFGDLEDELEHGVVDGPEEGGADFDEVPAADDAFGDGAVERGFDLGAIDVELGHGFGAGVGFDLGFPLVELGAGEVEVGVGGDAAFLEFADAFEVVAGVGEIGFGAGADAGGLSELGEVGGGVDGGDFLAVADAVTEVDEGGFDLAFDAGGEGGFVFGEEGSDDGDGAIPGDVGDQGDGDGDGTLAWGGGGGRGVAVAAGDEPEQGGGGEEPEGRSGCHGDASAAGAIEKEADHAPGQVNVEGFGRSEEMGADAVADGADQSVGQIGHTRPGRNHAGSAGFGEELLDLVEGSPSFGGVDTFGRDFAGGREQAGEYESGEIAVLVGEVEEGGGDGDELFFARGERGDGLLDQAEAFVEGVIQDGAVEAGLAFEVVVERGFGEVDFVEDVLDGGAGVALTGEETDGRVEDGLSGVVRGTVGGGGSGHRRANVPTGR